MDEQAARIDALASDVARLEHDLRVVVAMLVKLVGEAAGTQAIRPLYTGDEFALETIARRLEQQAPQRATPYPLS